MFSGVRSPLVVASALLAMFTAPVAAADNRVLESDSLNTCQPNSQFTAQYFYVAYWPGNNSALMEIEATSSISGFVEFEYTVSIYGYELMKGSMDPCTMDTGTDGGLAGLCPMQPSPIPLEFAPELPPDTSSLIPGIAFTFPDLDATVQMVVRSKETNESLACVEAHISNGKTVNLTAVKWVTAIIAGLVLCSSGVLSGLGHTNAAAHIASGALSLFGFFQAQAMIGLLGLEMPPIVQSWTQDFQWAMGIISVDFMQDIFTWYQRATGGEAATIFNTLTTTSVQVYRRGLEDFSGGLMRRGAPIVKRENIMTGSGSYIVYGIQRVAFMAGIETTNVVMTSLIFSSLLVVFTAGGVAAFKFGLELAAKKRWIKGDTFLDFRNGWLTILKGILFRLTIICYPAVVIFGLWEFTQIDSPAIVIVSTCFLIGTTGTLAWASWKVIRIARRSVTMHRNPAYMLFSDPQALNKWGFLYIQFRASAYYFIVPYLGYIIVKCMFIAFGQHSGTAQAIGFLLVEGAALIAASVMRPWMDKSTNSFNIAIAVVNFINSIFLLIFSDVFDQPPLVNGVVGLLLFFLNAIFATVLLLIIIITTILVFYRKNPDGRYQFMADDRASFMKSQSQLMGTTELDALGVAARGDKSRWNNGLDLEQDAVSISSRSLRRQTADSDLGTRPVSAYHSTTGGSLNPNVYHNRPVSPVDPSTPFIPSDSSEKRSHSPYNNPYGGPPSDYSHGSQHAQNNSSPWQRGAGYDS